MKYLKEKLGIAGILIVLVILLVVFIVTLTRNGVEKYEVVKGDFTKVVNVSGKVIPAQEIDLAFEVIDKVVKINYDIGDEVKAGDVVAMLDTSEIESEIEESNSSLEIELSKLSEIASVGSETTISNEREELFSVLDKAYVTADDIVKNKVDVFIEDSNSRFPEFNKGLSDYFLRQDINASRYEVGKALEDLGGYLDNITEVGSADSSYVISKLRLVEELLGLISDGSVDFRPNSSLTQSQIDAYISSISNSRSSLSAAILEINQTTESLRDTVSDVPVQEANVRSAEANLNKLNARLNGYVIVAPFDGVITGKEIEVGEISEPGRVAFSMIGNSGLEIETFIPEVLVAGTGVGDIGHAILDAFGSNVKFNVVVAHLDPRETEKDGITTYRVLVDFVDLNEDILPGMTAEVEIIKESINDVVLLPSHYVMEDDEGSYVISGDKDRIDVVVGPFDGKGSVVIESGLQEGDLIIIPEE